jgi:flavin reductase (DIM6/NTAB) family NADH-FMN oxidoreductase RutF
MSAFDVDFSALNEHERYKLLCALIVPRPIALVTTVNRDGKVNAAPFSFFNVFAEEPALVALGLYSQPDGSLKDTSANIRAMGAFTVNLIDEALAVRMNTCAVNFPAEISEIDAAELSTLPGTAIPVPRIAEAPAALECRHYMTLEVSARRRLCLGEVLHVHARPGVVDPARMYVNLDAYKPVARLFGNLYAGLGPAFELKRQTYDEWRSSSEGITEGPADRAALSSKSDQG